MSASGRGKYLGADDALDDEYDEYGNPLPDDAGHDHSWAEDMGEVRALCPDLNPELATLGIRCPGDTAGDPVAEQAQKRFAELTEMAENPDWLGI